MNLRTITVVCRLLLLSVGLFAQDTSSGTAFRFRHGEGEIHHADALVHESVYINGYFSHDAEIAESSVSRVIRVDPDGRASLESEFITSEQVAGRIGYREWRSSETVMLARDSRGFLDVPPDAGRPVLRNIPAFPDEPVAPGDSWTADAREVHLFRIGGRLWGPYSGDFPVSYIYKGVSMQDGRRLARIGISYNLYLPIRRSGEPVRMVSGNSDQLLYWDIDAGEPVLKEETFEFTILMSDGTSQEIVGSQKVHYRTLEPLDRTEMSAELQDVEDAGIVVSDSDDGILLTIDETDHILFAPESAVVSEAQVHLLQNLAAILENYQERDILITGHTANYGSPEGRRLLSRQRAESVAGILFPEGRPGPGYLYLRGSGAEEPVGSDAENRRVEILILD